MAYTIVIISTASITNDWIHKFRNFGEDIWKQLRDESEISLEEIDSCTDRFEIRGIKAKKVKRIEKLVLDISKGHFVYDDIDLEINRDQV